MPEYECNKCGKYAVFLYHVAFTDNDKVCKNCVETYSYEITKDFYGKPYLY